MPKAARDIRSLRRAIEDLRRQLLPKNFDPTNTYRNAKVVQARTRAFLVLAHAEFESYIEDWARELVKRAHATWIRDGRVVPPLDCLLATCPERLSVPKKIGTKPGESIPARLTAHLSEAVASYLKEVNENNGIKEANVSVLLGRLGVATSVFGTTLLPALTTYGERRGKHVHNSANTVAVELVLDPQDEYLRATQIIIELAPLHAWFVASRKKSGDSRTEDVGSRFLTDLLRPSFNVSLPLPRSDSSRDRSCRR